MTVYGILSWMSWYAVSNLEDGRGFSWRAISDPSEAAEGEKVIPLADLAGIVNPVWDAAEQRPLTLQEWDASRPDAPQGPGIAGRLLGPALEGTNMEPPNSIGSFGARLTYDLPVPSDEWTKIPFDEILWDTGGMFDPRHGAFVAMQGMRLSFQAGAYVPIEFAVGMVSLDFAIYRNGSIEHVSEGAQSGTPELRHRGMLKGLGRGFYTPEPLSALTGEVFEVYVRHDVGAEVTLTKKDVSIPDVPEMEQPTATYFMGTYQA